MSPDKQGAAGTPGSTPLEAHGSHPSPASVRASQVAARDAAVTVDAMVDGMVDGASRVAVLSGRALGAVSRLVDELAAQAPDVPAGESSEHVPTAELDEVTELLGGPDGAAEPIVLLAHRAAALRRERDNLRVALETNRTISAAVGVLMALRQLTYEDAFDLLVTTSQNHNRKLRDVAEVVVSTGLLPGEEGPE